MLTLKKADIKDIESLVITLMTMKQSEQNITIAEMHEYIDRTYYYEDSKYGIVAIVCATRQLLNEKTQYPSYTRIENPNRYQIKYALFNKSLIEMCDSNPARLMYNLIRELCADLNDWSVWIDIEFQSEINLGAEQKDTLEILSEAVTKNYFRKGINRFEYIRVMPIDFAEFH